MSGCKLCNYSDRTSIENRVASRQLSMTDAAKIVGCSKHSISRHMSNCVSSKVAKIANDIDQREALNVVNALTTSHDRVLTIYTEALADGDRKTALLAINAETKQLSLMHKIGLGVPAAPKEQVTSLKERAADLRKFLEKETNGDTKKQREIIGIVLKYAAYRRNSQ